MSDSKVKKTVGSVSTELVIGKGAAAISASLSKLEDAINVMKSMDSDIEDKTLQVVNLEQKIAQLENEFKEGIRKSNVEIELAFKQNQESFANKYLIDAGKVAISVADNRKYHELKESFNDNVEREVNKAIAAALREQELEFRQREINNQVNYEKLNAQCEQLKNEITSQLKQIDFLKNELEAQRKLTESIGTKETNISVSNPGTK